MKECPICGKAFEVKTSQTYCSKECYKKHVLRWHKKHREKGKTKIVEIKCTICGLMFLPRTRRLVICDKEECKKKQKLNISKRYRQTDQGKEARRTLENKKRAIERALKYTGKAVRRPRFKTKEGRLCFQVEKIIDDFFHQNKINHEWQISFQYNVKKKYIADWIIELRGEQIIIEYFGLYERNDKIGKEYKRKTKDKIKYYQSLKDFIFVPIYPQTLKAELKNITKFQLNYKNKKEFLLSIKNYKNLM